MIKDYECRVVKLLIAPKSQPIYSEYATTVEIYDESGGEFPISYTRRVAAPAVGTPRPSKGSS